MSGKDSETRPSGKDTPFGPSGARPEPDREKGRLDKPAKPEDDTATDERREKPVRGAENLDDQ